MRQQREVREQCMLRAEYDSKQDLMQLVKSERLAQLRTRFLEAISAQRKPNISPNIGNRVIDCPRFFDRHTKLFEFDPGPTPGSCSPQKVRPAVRDYSRSVSHSASKTRHTPMSLLCVQKSQKPMQ